MSNAQSWQIPCPRCGWANSGALTRCAKCGQTLGGRPGMLVAGQSLSAKAERPVSSKIAKPGGFLPRLIALIIDSMILLVVLLPIYALWVAQLAPLEIKPDTNLAMESLQRRGSLYLALFVLQVFYFAGSWTILGATPGQLLMNLRVTNAGAAGIGFFRALWRYLMLVFVNSLFGVGTLLSILMVLLNKNKRGLHDILAGTYVIQIVDQAEAVADTGLPAAFAGQTGAAPAPSPAPAPAPAPAPVAASPPAVLPAAAVAASAAVTAGAIHSARPTDPTASTDFAPPPLATEFPPAPLTQSQSTPYSPPPMAPATPPAEAGGDGQPDGDDGLYAPPPLVDPTTSLDDFTHLDPAAPGEREVYSPTPGVINERAIKSAELHTTTPELAAPAPTEATPPSAQPEAGSSAAAETASATPPAAPPSDGAELPPITFPPMSPPPDRKKK
ncbi:MAG TPA: RDD family protein [Candidatus Dormibacteraeota bacterium]